MNGRSYIDLLWLQAGVVPITSGASVTDRPVSGIGNAGNVSVNGQREAANEFLVNGGDMEEVGTRIDLNNHLTGNWSFYHNSAKITVKKWGEIPQVLCINESAFCGVTRRTTCMD